MDRARVLAALSVTTLEAAGDLRRDVFGMCRRWTAAPIVVTKA